ncbi:MAG TPA: hypothetical protein VJT71_10565 [Pyrinomonadaceae bacterium]|nr:hypothetical protein [Pyrinomonadaceae bacterium]
MTEEAKQKDDGSRVSDETLRQYLLCRLAESERANIDQLLLADNAFAERVEVAESQLIDEYASGELDPREQELFMSRFMTTDERRQKLRLSSALRQYAQPPSPVVQETRSTWWAAFSEFFSFTPATGWATVGSFALLLLVLGLAWWLTTRTSHIEPPVAKQQATPAVSPLPETSPAPIAQASQPEDQPTPETAAPATVASFVLLPGALRSGGEMTRVVVPGGERDIVRLNLVLEADGEGTYQAELATAEGQKVMVRSGLKAVRNGHNKIILTVPARLLHTRDYQIKLARQKSDGQPEPAGRYYFRALPE